MKAFPSAGEAVCYVPADQSGRGFRQVVEVPIPMLVGGGVAVTLRCYRSLGFGPWSPARPLDDERRAANRRRAGQRARTQVRRYCRGNSLDRMWTLTFDGEHLPADRAGVMKAGSEFVSRLRRHLGRKFAYVLVPEQGEGNGRWHLHLAVGFYIAKPLVHAIWGNGFVDARRFKPPPGQRHDPRRSAGLVAHYLAKYVEKAFDDEAERRSGEHRYEVGQGFQPAVVELDELEDEVTAFRAAVALVGDGFPSWMWSSAEVDGWEGPPVRVLRWSG